jgi:hypothetical protein
MFKVVNDYFRAEDISWANGLGICTDGAVTVTGNKKGFQMENCSTREHYTVYVSFQRDLRITQP